jgi:hypothetical protein
MKVLVAGLGLLAALALLVLLVGWLLPVRHRVSGQAEIPASPESVYATIEDVERYPTWRAKVRKVEHVVTEAAVRSYREFSDGGAILYVVDEAQPSRRRVTRIADDRLPFGGTWTFELAPTANGTAVHITEDGAVYHPLFRFMSTFVFSQHATIDGYLTDLGRKFGAVVLITR